MSLIRNKLKNARNASCLFVADLHGKTDRFEKLFHLIKEEPPAAVFIGGDISPSYLLNLSSNETLHNDFVNDFLIKRFDELRASLKKEYPDVFLILGNDDLRVEEAAVNAAASRGLWHYVHGKRDEVFGYPLYGYANVPPTPFRLKDWERYDISRYVEPGCLSPEEGMRSVEVDALEIKYGTIKDDIEKMTATRDMWKAIFLFHAPPYQTMLDRAALDGKMIDHAPLDVNIGSVAIKRFIETRQPLLTLHGHVHESARLTGSWQDKIGKTYAFSAAHDGPELAVVRFELSNLAGATRELI
jgi:Icc-related predicted phosphoesterase